MNPSPCPDDETIVAFCSGSLGADELGAAEEHLDGCAACAIVAAAGLARAAPAAEAPPLLGALTFKPGQIVAGRYRIVRFIAHGGMGEVYEAEDTVLRVRVAVKTVSVAASDDGRALDRLRREVRIARQVTHPNVCRVYDLESGADGVFVTMELLEGETLGARIRRAGALPAAEVAALLPEIVSALAAAHGAGVVHRDFKSDNIMLCAPSRGAHSRRIAVMDFGLARPATPDPALATASNDDRRLAGSVAYMAPEQVTGAGPIGPPVDIYALGVVLFEALTGHVPFIAANATETATMRLTRSAPRLDAIAPQLPSLAAWEPIVGRCLARDRRQRFARADEVVAALATAQSAGAPRRRTAAAVAVAVAVLVSFAWWWLGR
jgi:serine/threonine protein kinase